LKGCGFRRAAKKDEHFNQGRLKAAAESLAKECGVAGSRALSNQLQNYLLGGTTA